MTDSERKALIIVPLSQKVGTKATTLITGSWRSLALGVWRRLRRSCLISLVNSPAWAPKRALVTSGMRRDGGYLSGSNILPDGGGDAISKSRGQTWGFGGG